MAGAGVASFIDGVFKGADWREARDDRAAARKRTDERFEREKEDWDWQDEQRGQERTNWAWTGETRDQQRTEWGRSNRAADQAEADAAAERKAKRDAGKAALESYDAERGAPASGGTGVRATDQAIPSRPTGVMDAMAQGPDDGMTPRLSTSGQRLGFGQGSTAPADAPAATPAAAAPPAAAPPAGQPPAAPAARTDAPPAAPGAEQQIGAARTAPPLGAAPGVMEAIGDQPYTPGFEFSDYEGNRTAPALPSPAAADAAPAPGAEAEGNFPMRTRGALPRGMTRPDQFDPAPAAAAPAAPENPIPEVDENGTQFQQDIGAWKRRSAISGELAGIVDGLNNGAYGTAPPSRTFGINLSEIGDYLTAKPDDNMGAQRARAERVRDWYASPEARAHFDANPGGIAKAKADPLAYYAMQEGAPPAPRAAGPSAPSQPAPAIAAAPAQPGAPGADAAPAAPPAPQSSASNGIQPAPASERTGPLTFGVTDTGVLGAVTPEGTPAVGVEIAAQTVGAPGTMNMGVPSPFTPEQRTRAGKTFMDHYMTAGAPKMVRHYLETGQIEKAQAFDEWMEQTQTKKALESFGYAMHAAAIGDDEGFIDHLGDTYNSPGYFDDGYTLERKGSRLIRDKAGNFAGAELAFRNDETGEVHVMQVDGEQDLYELGIGILEPGATFERGWEAVKAEKAKALSDANKAREFKAEIEKIRAKAIAEGQVKAGEGDTFEKRVLKAIETLSKGTDFGMLPAADQVQQATEFVLNGRIGPAPTTDGTNPTLPIHFSN